MILSDFFSKFKTEPDCREFLKEQREKHGVVCKRCKGTKQYWLRAKGQWQCAHCDFRTTLKSGTIFESTKVSLLTWFHGIYLICNTKKGMSACEVQRQLGIRRYEPVWYMLQKIRCSMLSVNDLAEQTYGFTYNQMYEGRIGKLRKNESYTQIRKREILVMWSQDYETGKISGKMKMTSIHRLSLKEMQDIEKGHKIETNYIARYKRLVSMDTGFTRLSKKPSLRPKIPWVEIAIINAKKILMGIHHFVSGKYVQLYLNEFTFKYNYRWHPDRWKILFCSALGRYW